MQNSSEKTLTSAEIRTRFLAFFEKRGHTIIPSASLVTSDEKGVTNPTLFNTAGMQPLIPYLLGEPYIDSHGKEVNRLADVQKCVRTVDIDDIGDKTHATFFEMLGNWSLGDYFKKDAIEWSFEFLTSKDEGLGLDPQRLYVSVFEGDSNAPKDEEAANIWREVFKKNRVDAGGDTSQGEAGRIFYLPAKNNWWEAGDNGPCGPDTEMFYDVSDAKNPEGHFGGKLLTHEEYVKADDERTIIEIWNDVFMQYEKKDGKIIGKLAKPSVDTGAGLERLTMTLQEVDNIYDTDLLRDMFLIARPMTQENVESARIVADHIKAAVFLIADGVIPSNSGRGYVLRRLIRRAVFNTHDKQIDRKEISLFVQIITDVVYKNLYQEILNNKDTIIDTIYAESEQFRQTINNGIKEFNRIAEGKTEISSARVFSLFTTFGLPIDMIVSLAKEKGMSVDIAGFETEFKKHQSLSRSGAEQKFKGGLADANDPMVLRYHTATHLLHQALHDVLGQDSGHQKGSNITAERLRFDFTGQKLTDEQKQKVEDIVNQKIAEKLPMNQITLPKVEAEKTGARHFFGDKYGDDVSIYFIGHDLENAYSKEFCGGPHVKNTSELAGPEGKWKFKIQKEEAVSQGVRRIKAVLG
jgi:alanyl-tRNA synthetase